MLLEESFVVAFLLRRILRRRPTGHNQTLHGAAGDSAIVAAYPALKDGACAAHWSRDMVVPDRHVNSIRLIRGKFQHAFQPMDWLEELIRLAQRELETAGDGHNRLGR